MTRKTMVLRVAAVLVMAVGGISTKPKVAQAADCATGFCVFECPPHVDLYCQSWNCSATGASCSFVDCLTEDYKVTCGAAS